MRATGERSIGATPAAEARTLGQACAIAGAVSLWTAVVPFSATAPRGLAVALGALGLALGGAVLRAGGRTPAAATHGILVLATLVVSACVLTSTTPAGRVLTSYGYVWIAVFTAWYHPRRVAAAHLGLLGAAFAAALVAGGAPAPVQTWTFALSTVGGVAVVLNALVARLRDLADRDPLTGLLSRAAFTAAAERAIALARRSGRPLTLALLDLNDFKLVNDREGHAAGDRLLTDLTAAWQGAIRGGDVLGRHGGDEFVLLLPDTSVEEAATVLDRFAAVSDPDRWSAGVAGWAGDDLDAWLARADGHLYDRKRARRRPA